MTHRGILIFMMVVMSTACDRAHKASANMNTSKSPQAGYAPVNGIKMYYEIHGAGKPLVLIHGGGSTIQTSFGTILPQLSEHYKVIAVELQAHGHTSDRDAPESFEQDADDVAALLKFLNIEKADIMGFSNGGNTSMKIAIRHPGMVNKLILVSSFYKRSGMVPGFFEGMKDVTLNSMPDYLKEAFLAINQDSAALQAMFEIQAVEHRLRRAARRVDADLAELLGVQPLLARGRHVRVVRVAPAREHGDQPQAAGIDQFAG